jgi:hypothetical protein
MKGHTATTTGRAYRPGGHMFASRTHRRTITCAIVCALLASAVGAVAPAGANERTQVAGALAQERYYSSYGEPETIAGSASAAAPPESPRSHLGARLAHRGGHRHRASSASTARGRHAHLPPSNGHRDPQAAADRADHMVSQSSPPTRRPRTRRPGQAAVEGTGADPFGAVAGPRSCLDGRKHGRRREFDLPRLVAERPEVNPFTSCFGVA